MAYLQPGEYVAYGLSAETSDAWVAAASVMMEAYCKRASLLSATYTERLRVSRGIHRTQLSYQPVLQVTAVQARYSPNVDVRDDLLMQWALTFGAPGRWVSLDPTTVTLDAVSGELQLPWNLLGMQYSEVEVTYTAGLTAVPDAVKFACAQIVKNAQATPGLNVRSSKLDTLQTQYFSDSLLDSGVKALLRPFVAESMG